MTLSKNADRYISGIHNYCDKWCERCRLANKCVVYADTERKKAEHISKGEDPDDINIVMEDVKKDLEKTMRLLKKISEKEGIDLESLPDKEALLPDIKKHPLNVDCLAYMQKAHVFLKKLTSVLKAEKNDIFETVRLIPSAEEEISHFEGIIDHYEVIAWYHTLIPAKIYRALSSKFEAVVEKDAELAQINLDDANGSAKVAYFGLKKSIISLQKLFKWNEPLQNEALNLMVDADRMRKSLDAEFPGHHAFKRPGFDG